MSPPPTKEEVQHIELMFSELTDYFEEKSWTNDFFESLKDWWDRKAFLTPKQYTSLQDMYDRWC